MTAKQKKSPAFQFYPSDFLGSPKVRAMTLADIGLYLLALCLDWEGDGFTEPELQALAESQRATVTDFAGSWSRVRECFGKVSERFRNARLDSERKKQRAWRRKSSKGGKLGMAKRWAGRDKGGVTVVTPNDNIPSPSPTPVTTTTKTKTTTARGTAARVATPGWLDPCRAVWEDKFGAGSFPWGKAGRQLKPLREANDPHAIAGNLKRYLADTDAKYVSLARFAETFAQYAPSTEPLVDEFGCLTPYGERVTRPAGLRIA